MKAQTIDELLAQNNNIDNFRQEINKIIIDNKNKIPTNIINNLIDITNKMHNSTEEITNILCFEMKNL